MTDPSQLTTVETVHEDGSWLFTVRDQYDELDEVLLVPCEDGDDADKEGVEAWVNRCTHEAQRFDRGFGAPMRNGEIICPKHGSMFDACSGYCDNGEAADTTLVSVEVAVEDGTVYLTDAGYGFAHEGSIEDGDNRVADGENETDDETGSTEGENDNEDDEDDVPSSTSHIGF